jgi:hypothetical protein
MIETEPNQPENRTGRFALMAGAVAIVILFAVALYLISDLRGRVNLLEAGAQRQNAETKVIEDKAWRRWARRSE